jgi:hypothetical protein
MTDEKKTAIPAPADQAAESPNSDLLDGRKIVVGKMEIPPITLLTAILLEKVDSPFVRIAINPLTGLKEEIIPTMEEIATTLYVVLNQTDPRIWDVIEDKAQLSRTVLNMASTISFKDMQDFNKALSAAMIKANQAAKEAGLEQSPKKDATGPSA